MMVLARLFADGWRARFGDKRVVVIGAALAGCGPAVAATTEAPEALLSEG
jgi:hypothetical protein